jgi:hypothetical protein
VAFYGLELGKFCSDFLDVAGGKNLQRFYAVFRLWLTAPRRLEMLAIMRYFFVRYARNI